jgi:hypothetical protein
MPFDEPSKFRDELFSLMLPGFPRYIYGYASRCRKFAALVRGQAIAPSGENNFWRNEATDGAGGVPTPPHMV